MVGEPFLHSGRAGFDPLVPYFNSTHARVAQPVAAAALETVQCGFDSHPVHSQEHGVTAAHSADYRRVPVQIWVFLLCGIRLTEKMLGFHPKDRGSTPLPRTLLVLLRGVLVGEWVSYAQLRRFNSVLRNFCPLRLTARIPGSHPVNTGSTPVGGTVRK